MVVVEKLPVRQHLRRARRASRRRSTSSARASPAWSMDSSDLPARDLHRRAGRQPRPHVRRRRGPGARRAAGPALCRGGRRSSPARPWRSRSASPGSRSQPPGVTFNAMVLAGLVAGAGARRSTTRSATSTGSAGACVRPVVAGDDGPPRRRPDGRGSATRTAIVRAPRSDRPRRGLGDGHLRPGARAAVLPQRPVRRLVLPADGGRAALVAVVASLLVARDVRAGARPPARRRRPLGAASRRRSAGSTRAYDRVLGAVRAAPPVPARSRSSSSPACSARVVRRRPARSRSRCCPASRTPTSSCTGTGPPARRCPRWTASPRGPPPSSGCCPASRDVGAHVGQAVLGDRAVGADSAEMWVSIDPSADYEQTVTAVDGVVAGYPGLRHEVVTYTEDRIDRGARRTDGAGHGAGLRRGPRRAAEEGRGGPADRWPGSTACATRTRSPAAERAHDGGRGRPGQGPASRDQARRRPPGRGDPAVGPPVGSLFEQQKVFDVRGVEHAGHPHSLDERPDLLLDTPDGGQVRLGDVADVRMRADAADHRARGHLALRGRDRERRRRSRQVAGRR